MQIGSAAVRASDESAAKSGTGSNAGVAHTIAYAAEVDPVETQTFTAFVRLLWGDVIELSLWRSDDDLRIGFDGSSYELKTGFALPQGILGCPIPADEGRGGITVARAEPWTVARGEANARLASLRDEIQEVLELRRREDWKLLRERLQSPHWYVRDLAAIALGQGRTLDARLLAEVAAAEERELRELLALALSLTTPVGEADLDALAMLAVDDAAHEGARGAAVLSLGRAGEDLSARAVEVLLVLLEHDGAVAGFADMALARLAGIESRTL